MTAGKGNHPEYGWKVDEVALDFILWDVWEFPITANNSQTENFHVFEKIFWKGMNALTEGVSCTSFLMALRRCVSKIFPLDKNVNTLPIPGCRETTIKSRLHDKFPGEGEKTVSFQDTVPEEIFSPVYTFENESLYELSNDTVHALIHLGWINKEKSKYTATMAVYIKPRGIFGKIYLEIIKPFRHLIVYPEMMKKVQGKWREYISELQSGQGHQ